MRLYSSRTGQVEQLAPKRLMRLRASGDLRAYVLSDLLRRFLERRRIRMEVWWDAPVPDGQALNLRPPEHLGEVPDQVDLAIETHFDGDVTENSLSVRLAALETHYRRPLTLTQDLLRAADQRLRHWRSQVALWAEEPSAALAAPQVAAIEAALDDDLDSPTALRLLGELERDESLTPGAKLESFFHLDNIFALDLSTEIGKPR